MDLGPPSPSTELLGSPIRGAEEEESRRACSISVLHCLGLNRLRSWDFLPSQVVLYEADPHGRLWIRLDDLQAAVSNFLTRLD